MIHLNASLSFHSMSTGRTICWRIDILKEPFVFEMFTAHIVMPQIVKSFPKISARADGI